MTTIHFEPNSHGAPSLPRWFGAARTASIAFAKRFYEVPPPATFFHYTSTAALISIVRNNELWLSDATFLNDRVEIEHGRKLACGRLEAAISIEQRLKVRQMLEHALSRFRAQIDPHVYVACFSLEGDDLAQWRGYGQGDAPIAIEFKHGPLMFGYTSEGQLQQVLYETDDQVWTFDQVLTAYIDAYVEDLMDPRPSYGPEPLPQEEQRNLCAESLYHALWHYIVACKDPAFRSEREVRFTYTAHDFSQSGADWHPEHPAPLFRERAGRVVPYLSSKNLHFRNMDRRHEAPKLPIRSVRIGPIDDQALIARGMRRLLDTFDHSTVEIALSSLPFRPR
ncbi:DUF2971 domain-containing protein [Ensifer sp. ENS12]|uniref:DUF2971 domain-containing protein n=1 Tax=Ensifer sp. ENS12 TaxID=2854774 RepID=UPI001C44A75F|nr:DUF2971 domain-containing protein [Ensifer sp. ENS12]MBV7519030.1 DUF2971 domain-containing protein [Ensifer sp. ENS12]